MLTIKYYGVEGSGRTVTEAKKDAGRKIEIALAGDYNPVIIVWRKHAYLIYRDPTVGWRDRLICDEDGVRDGTVFGSFGGDSMDKEYVIAEAKKHLAKLGWEEVDGQEIPSILPFCHHRGWRDWTEFQLRYREAIRRGMNDNDAHSYAGRNPSRPELWQEEAKV
jgi:hypothetical protein